MLDWDELLRAGATLTAIGIFYGYFYTRVVARWGLLVRPMLALLQLGASHPLREIDSLGKLAAAGVAQALFAVALLAVLGMSPLAIAKLPSIGTVALGVALGVSELGTAAFIATIVVKVAVQVSGERMDTWLGPGRGGWMGQFLASSRVAPRWLFASCVILYVGGEEVVFRAILIDLLRPLGPAIGIGLPAACFVGVQALHMPSVRSTIFPMVGGIVVGIVHSIIYWQSPEVLPLIVAHVTFFVGALLSSGTTVRQW